MPATVNVCYYWCLLLSAFAMVKQVVLISHYKLSHGHSNDFYLVSFVHFMHSILFFFSLPDIYDEMITYGADMHWFDRH